MITQRIPRSCTLKVVSPGLAGILGFTLLLVCHQAQTSAQQPPTDDAAASSAVQARGAALFSQQCAICHGETGDGQGKFAYLMNPRPRNFQKGDFKLSTTQSQIPTDDDLLRTISRGMPGSAMPPWGHLPQNDLDALVQHVRKIYVDAVHATLVGRGREGERLATELTRRTEPGPPLVIPPEPPFDNLRWFRGRRIYLEGCASCHGEDGEPVADAVKFDNEGYPVPPRSFVNGIFKGGSESHQLYARIFKGLKGTPMPAFDLNYTSAEIWDMIHYIQSLARAGAQERAQLRQGTFAAARVSGALPQGPTDTTWDRARPLYVALTPLWWSEDCIRGLVVQALHNNDELAIRLSWIDPSLDDRAVRHDEFRDGVAIQFSLTSDPPFYMGGGGDHGGVNIWFWKADRHKNLATSYQDVDTAFPDRAVDMYPEQNYKTPADKVGEPWPLQSVTEHDPTYITAWGAGNIVADPTLKTSVETLVARGPGTLASMPANIQFVQGKAEYSGGVWSVQMQRTMKTVNPDSGDQRVFKSGDYLPLSFAIWNGSGGDRDGKKNISIWQKLVIE